MINQSLENTMQKKFILAVQDLNVEEIDVLSKQNIDVNQTFAKDGENYTPLTYAIKFDSLKMVQALLMIKGIDLRGSLEIAAKSNNKEIVFRLLQNIDLGRREIGIAFRVAKECNSKTIEVFLDDYFAQMINYPEDVRGTFKDYPWILDILTQKICRKYLFDKLIQHAYKTEGRSDLPLLHSIIDSENKDLSIQHPLYRVFSKPKDIYEELTSTINSWASIFSSEGIRLDTRSELEKIKFLLEPSVGSYVPTGNR